MLEQTNTQEAPPDKGDSADRPEKYVVVRYGRMGHVGMFCHHLESVPEAGTMLVVRSERGTELGRTLVNVGDEPGRGFIPQESLDEYLRANGPDYPFHQGGQVLRLANPQDLNDQQHLDRSAGEEAAYCRGQIAQLHLEMKLVDVEHLLGGERIVFCFTAAQRVDFRELVKRMATQYHTRIEMRQVGARDEARLAADYERCGRHCCCRQFLKFLKPITMRMARMQKATLDPTKISGRCGRLMCCLRFEDATYEELANALPKKNTWIRTADDLVGKVTDMQLLTQLVELKLPDGQRRVVPNEDIAERDVAEPAAQPSPQPRPKQASAGPRPAPTRKQDRLAMDQLDQKLEALTPKHQPGPAPKEAAASEKPAQAATPGKEQQRRRPKKKHPQALSVSPSLPSQSARPTAATGQGRPKPPSGPKPKKKRRRRRKRRPQGGQSPNKPQQ